MIDWKASAELNRISVKELKVYFEKFPKSNKKIIAVCEGCGKVRELSFQGYFELCHPCAQSERFKDPEKRKKHKIAHNTPNAIKNQRDAALRRDLSYLDELVIDHKEPKWSDYILWDITAEKNGMSIEYMKAYFYKYPKSCKKIITICKECGKEREILFMDHSNICKACACATPESRKNRQDAQLKRYENPKEREKSSIIMRKVYEDPKEREKLSIAQQKRRIRELGPKKSRKRLSYCPLFDNPLKIHIRNKNHNRCYLCGKSKKENGQNLDVHHIEYDKQCLCDGLPCVLIPLCKSCHGKTHYKRWYWTDLFLGYIHLVSHGELTWMIDL